MYQTKRTRKIQRKSNRTTRRYQNDPLEHNLQKTRIYRNHHRSIICPDSLFSVCTCNVKILAMKESTTAEFSAQRTDISGKIVLMVSSALRCSEWILRKSWIVSPSRSGSGLCVCVHVNVCEHPARGKHAGQPKTDQAPLASPPTKYRYRCASTKKGLQVSGLALSFR